MGSRDMMSRDMMSREMMGRERTSYGSMMGSRRMEPPMSSSMGMRGSSLDMMRDPARQSSYYDDMTPEPLFTRRGFAEPPQRYATLSFSFLNRKLSSNRQSQSQDATKFGYRNTVIG